MHLAPSFIYLSYTANRTQGMFDGIFMHIQLWLWIHQEYYLLHNMLYIPVSGCDWNLNLGSYLYITLNILLSLHTITTLHICFHSIISNKYKKFYAPIHYVLFQEIIFCFKTAGKEAQGQMMMSTCQNYPLSCKFIDYQPWLNQSRIEIQFVIKTDSAYKPCLMPWLSLEAPQKKNKLRVESTRL